MKLKLDIELTAASSVTVDSVNVDENSATLNIGGLIKKTFLIEAGVASDFQALVGQPATLTPSGDLSVGSPVTKATKKTGSMMRPSTFR